jgi:tetratricopeptide (TPR) repeat protein
MVDLLQAKLTGEGGPRAADTRSVLAAVRDAGGSDTDDLPGDAVNRVARKIGAGRVLQGSIVGPPDHLVISASLVAMPSGRTVAQTTVDGPKDSLFVLVDRLTAKLLALGAGATSNQLSALTTTNLDALRAYLDGVTAYRRAAFEKSTPLLERAVQLDSTFALALSALIESDGWHPAAGNMNRVRRLAWQYRDRLNPQDQAFLTLRLGSMYPRQTPWQVQIADAEKAAQAMPESADAWYWLGDGLFHGGRLADIPDPEARARQAFEKAFDLDSLYGGPITHLARLNFVTGDTAAQRLWTRRQIALDSTAESVPAARWDLLQSSRDAAGVKAFLAALPSQPINTPRAILFQNPRDSVTIANQPELLDVVHQLATNRAERNDMAFSRWFYLLNGGKPKEADRWLDTLRTINPGAARLQSVLGAIWYGGNEPDSATVANNPGAYNALRLSQGDLSVAPAVLKEAREAAAKDTLQGFWYHWAPLVEAWVAVEEGRPDADRLLDVADSLWRGREGFSAVASLQLARLYEKQGRTDRALRAVRRRYSPNGEPEPPGLAEAYRLEGQYAAKLGDRADAIRAYRNYLRMRVDPEPSRIPQRDSVRAELAKVGDLEGAK